MHTPGFRERYAGGSPEAERLQFLELARDIMDIQLASKKRAGAADVDRAFHAKAILGVVNATLRVSDDIPKDLELGHFRARAEYDATVRLSNANGAHQAD